MQASKARARRAVVSDSSSDSESEASETTFDLYHLFRSNPTFYVVVLADQGLDSLYQQSKCPQRESEELYVLIEKIQILNGRVIAEPQDKSEGRRAIPLLFVTADEDYNTKAFKAWKAKEVKCGRFHDAFHENFIHDIFTLRKLVDIKDYLVGISIFENYDDLSLLSNTHKWTSLTLLPSANFSASAANSVQWKSGSPPINLPPQTASNQGVRQSPHKTQAAKNPRLAAVAAPAIPNHGLRQNPTGAAINRTQPPAMAAPAIPSQGVRQSPHQPGSAKKAPPPAMAAPNPSRGIAPPAQSIVASSRALKMDPPPPEKIAVFVQRPEPPPSTSTTTHSRPRGGAIPGKPRLPPISLREQREILRYIIENNEYDRVRGKDLFKEMEASGIVNRSFHTLQTHIRKILLKRSKFDEVADSMNMDPIARANFQAHIREDYFDY